MITLRVFWPFSHGSEMAAVVPGIISSTKVGRREWREGVSHAFFFLNQIMVAK